MLDMARFFTMIATRCKGDPRCSEMIVRIARDTRALIAGLE